MSRLTAIYEIDLPRGLRVQRAVEDRLSYQVNIGQFDVEIVLIRNGGSSTKIANQLHEIRLIEKIQLAVSREEDSDPPPIIQLENGRDLSARSRWIGERKNAYTEIARLITNRLIRFFKYKVKTPHLREYVGYEESFKNPRWQDQSGQPLESGIVEHTARVISHPGPTLLGERSFTSADDANFEKYLAADMNPETYEELLSDAQSSGLTRNLERAILEMAITCEVVVKQLFFGSGAISTLVFDYLEDKGRINIRVIDMLDVVAKHALGESFKETNPNAYLTLIFYFGVEIKSRIRANYCFGMMPELNIIWIRKCYRIGGFR